ncbi:hypothetical protein KFE98_16315 [bacterium SCSIO 12741]|nr:hypothetical protein KFE98_16315 [bacterium SCSIO 12741]
MKSILPFLVFLMMSATTFAQDYIVVKLYEPINKPGEIVIAYGNGKSERIPVEKLNSTHHEHNCNQLVDVFNRLGKQGYELETSAGSSHGNSASILHVDTFVFVKEDE